MTENLHIRNDQIVNALASSIRKGATGLHNVPALLKQIIREDMWRDRVVESTGERVTFRYFGAFVEADPPDGLGEELATLRRLCSDDTEAVDLLDQATQRTPADNQPVNNINGQDRPQGTSAAQALRKLRSDAPELHERVVAGDLSPHAAMVEAGFRRKTVSIPVDDMRAIARTLVRHLTVDQIEELTSILTGDR